jgi:hypothetical protein
MEFYDLEGQRQRRKQVLEALKEYTLDYFDEQGNWTAAIWSPGPTLRERLWFALAYLGDDEERTIRLANRIIVGSKHRPCHFSPMAALQILVKHGSKLDTDARQALTTYLEHMLPEFDRPDLDFVGVNDNFPCMSTFTALMGGKLFALRTLYDTGVKRLHQLKALLSRRGVDTEFTSPTYTSIHAFALAEIANYVDDDALREIALQCEERIWVDLLGHYHAPTSQIAGPYSRAYTVDSAGYTHQARYILYALLGGQMAIHPMNTIFTSKHAVEGDIIHNGLPFMQVSTAWIMSADLHCPPALVDAMLNKTYPFVFKATMEYGPSTDAPVDSPPNTYEDIGEYAAGNGSISTYMTEDYALGVATGEFHCGVQTDVFHLLYRRRTPLVQQADLSTVYARYLINEKKPGQTNRYPAFAVESGDNLLWDEGRKLGIHHESAAMMLYRPKQFGRKGVESLKLSLLFPAQYGSAEEVWLGSRKLDGEQGSSQDPCPVFVKDGPVYMAFHPLILTNHGREAAVRVELVNGYVVVSFYNYQGPSRDFSEQDFLLTGNGFVAEVGSEQESGSFASFRRLNQEPHIHDELFTCTHYRWRSLRRTKYEREGLTLECEYSPVMEGIKCITVNGRIPQTPILQLTGLDSGKLPFIIPSE